MLAVAGPLLRVGNRIRLLSTRGAAAVLEVVQAAGRDNNTIVVYATDNGVGSITWPDGGTTPFCGEKATN